MKIESGKWKSKPQDQIRRSPRPWIPDCSKPRKIHLGGDYSQCKSFSRFPPFWQELTVRNEEQSIHSEKDTSGFFNNDGGPFGIEGDSSTNTFKSTQVIAFSILLVRKSKRWLNSTALLGVFTAIKMISASRTRSATKVVKNRFLSRTCRIISSSPGSKNGRLEWSFVQWLQNRGGKYGS